MAKTVSPEQCDEMRAAVARGRKTITLKLGDKRTMTFSLTKTADGKHIRYRAIGTKSGFPMGVIARRKESPDQVIARLWPDD